MISCRGFTDNFSIQNSNLTQNTLQNFPHLHQVLVLLKSASRNRSSIYHRNTQLLSNPSSAAKTTIHLPRPRVISPNRALPGCRVPGLPCIQELYGITVVIAGLDDQDIRQLAVNVDRLSG